MSFLFNQRKPSSQERIAMAVAEVDIMTDMMQRLGKACFMKCVPTDHREEDLNKGESVCLDRCVAKYMEMNMKVTELMQQRQANGGM